MRQGAVKIFDKHIEVRRGIRLSLHAHISLSHRLRHLSLAHKLSRNGVAPVKGALCVGEYFFEIVLAAAEARRPEEENLFVFKPLQKLERGFICVSPVRPKSDIEHFRFGHLGGYLTEIIAVFFRQSLVYCIGKKLGVAR